MQEIIRKDRESIDNLIRRFKKQSRDDLVELREHRYYKKPALKRHKIKQDRKWLKKKVKESLEKKILEKKLLKKRGFGGKIKW